MKKVLALLLAALMLIGLVACGQAEAPAETPAEDATSEAPSTDAGEEIHLALVTGDQGNAFFVSMKTAAEAAAKANGVKITVLGSTSLQENIQNIEDLIQTGVDAIGICPFDAQGNIPVIEECNAAGIPVFTLDEDVSGGDVVAYIGTDNYTGGFLAGEWLIEKVNGTAKVAVLEGGAGSYTSNVRLQGFKDATEGTDIEIVSSIAADWSRDKGMTVMSDIIAGNPDLDVVFALNDDMAAGAMEALKTAGRTDVIIIGFNGTAEAIQNVARGDFDATVVQFPEEMGRIYVESALDVILNDVYPADHHIKPPVAVVDTNSAAKIYKAVTGKAYSEPVIADVEPATKADGSPIRIGLVTGDQGNAFFVSMKEAAETAAASYGVDITVLGSTSLQENIQNIEDLIQTGVDAIGICPFDAQGNIPVIEECNAAGIPVFTLDEDVSGGDVVAYIGTDNYTGGFLAGEWLIEKVNGTAKVAVLEGGAGSYTSNVRLQGFKDATEGTDIEIVSSIAADWSRDKGMTVMSDIIAGNPDLDVVFALNDDMAAGAMEALKTADRTDVLVIGFNGTGEAILNVYNGDFEATVVQYPEEMGALYVENAVKLIVDGISPAEHHIKPAVQLLDSTFAQKIISSLG